MENFLDKKINAMALEVFTSQGKSKPEIDYDFTQLRFAVDRGILSRSFVIGLLKMAKVGA